MEATEFESDALLKLLTDAIRRGPGSPEWHEAVARLRNSGAQSSDEYRLLMDVRDRLESGKTYRQVRAGPEFTRAVFENLDQPVSHRKPVVTFVVSFISLLILVGSVAMLLKLMSNTRDDQSVVRLSNQLFTTIQKNWSFNTGSLPAEFKTTGPLKYVFGLKIDLDPASNEKQLARVMLDEPLELTAGVCIEAVVSYRPGENNQMNLFLTSPSKEIEVDLSQNGFYVSSGESLVINKSLPGGEYTIRIKAQQSTVVIEVNGQTIWTGMNQLNGPARLSLAFQRTGKSEGDIRVQSLKILTP